MSQKSMFSLSTNRRLLVSVHIWLQICPRYDGIRFVQSFRPLSLGQNILGSLSPRPSSPCPPSYRRSFGSPSPGSWFCGSRSSSYLPFASTGDVEKKFVEAEALFGKNCDSDGLMTKQMLQQLAVISELLDDGDLLQDELDSIWNAAPKFPDIEKSDEERIDVDSFVQIYRDIDDLFEDDEEEEESTGKTETDLVSTDKPALSAENGDEDEYMEDELETIFRKLCDKNGLITKESIQKWDELQKLFGDGLLGDDEFDTIWAKTPKRRASPDQLDLEGFLSFNVALDSLFEFDDLDEDEGNDEDGISATDNGAPASSQQQSAKEIIDDYDISPEALFAALADDKGQIGLKNLKRWGELQEMIEEGELLPLELQNIFDGIAKVAVKPDRLDKRGFLAFYSAIDSLFEVDDTEDAGSKVSNDASSGSCKLELLEAIDQINSDKDRLPCGLESTEREQRLLMQLVADLEAEPTNVIRQKQGAIELSDIAGEWDLLYTSSSAMQFNKGLSGIGGSFPNGRFGGLKQKLSASKYMTDVEYIEHIAVKPDTASFDVRVNGSWELRTSVSIFTGDPSIVLNIVPEKVTYGPTSTRADHWKSLGPTNMLDVTYLDDSIRVMRGNTATDAVFVFRKVS